MLLRSVSLGLAAGLCAWAVDVPAAKLRMFKPLPSAMDTATNTASPAKIDLGRMLYFDNRLSKNQKLSCNSCHMLDKYGVDNEPTSEGHKDQRGDRNSPTVYNAAGHIVQFWDGRAADVEAQAKGPVLNPVEMAMPSEAAVVAVLKSIPGYAPLFQKAFPGEKDPLTYDNMAKAIGAFERRLVTPARWDKFLGGDQKALSDNEKSGFLKFVELGCSSCHMGAYVGGSMFQKMGVVTAYPDTKDEGRAKVTKNGADKYVFKVPSLRNIEKTAPYFHHGQARTLEQAVNEMGHYQLGKKLTAAETTSLVAWLKTLTGEIPAHYIKPPQLPASSDKTPKPVLN